MAPRHQLYLGNLDQRVTRRMLYELGIQAGPVVDVSLPASLSGAGIRGFGFIEFETEETLDYAFRLLEGRVTLFGRPCSIEKSGRPTRGMPGGSRQAPQQQQQLKVKPEQQKQDPMQELDYNQQQQLIQQHAFMQQQLAYTQHALMYQHHVEQSPPLPPPPPPQW